MLPRRLARRPLRRGLVTALAAAALLVPALSHTPASADGVGLPALPTIPGLPIVPLPTDLLVPRFTGAAAVARPVPHPEVPQNPWLSPNGTSSMHNDAYSSDAYEVAGPLGRDLAMTTASYGIRECATAAFDSRGRLVGLCGGLEGFMVMVIDPVSLRAISQLQISQRDLLAGGNPFTDICGGTYFVLDKRDHAIATTADASIVDVAVRADGSLRQVAEWPLADRLPEGDCLVATTLDWSGRVWFFSQQGYAGTLDRRTGAVHVVRLGTAAEPEGIFNSVSSDETGGVYAVTTHALYRLDAARDGVPDVTWRAAYDRGSRKKPGMLSQGSGTSPTLLGRRWIAITDNADPRTRVLVLDRRRGVADDERLHCAVPIFGKDTGTTENSLVSTGDGFVAENNYGYEGVQTTTLGRTTTPGLTKVELDPDGCHIAWTNDSIAPTSVAKASWGNGLLYAYTKPKRSDLIDAWYVTAIDLRTGKTVWNRLTGTGIQWNNHYAAIYLGPDGALYVATLTGLIRLADGSSS
ncbi:hypothetical protein [Nocardioides fonticola]|uniref:hypothetical protein n=1 Tax=Nocardioides fonticola TaxID=450363 RepID=UPI0031D7DBD5